MRPILLKGHERSITALKYNREGDLLFTASKATSLAVWYTDNGERLGTYGGERGHKGAIWSISVTGDSAQVLSGSADRSVKLWEAETGDVINTWDFSSVIRSVEFSQAERSFLTVTDTVLKQAVNIAIWDARNHKPKPAMEIVPRTEAKAFQGTWADLNRQILTANEDGTVSVYDVRRTGDVLKTITDHQKAVMEISWNKERNMFITSSKDGTAKLWDLKGWSLLKTYTVNRPINTASISPIKEEIIVAGGQSAETVTTTRVDSAQFRIRFFHSIYEEEMGSVQGHFGPVNVVAYSPDGSGFASGGEDGFVRLHHFDNDYFKLGKEDSH